MDVRTLTDMFRYTCLHRARPDAFRERRSGRWVEYSSRRLADDVAAIGEGLVGLGLAPGDRVAILSENRYAWAVADFASITRGGVVVPIYATLPAAQVAGILADSGARFVFASSADQVQKVLSIGAGLADIRAIVVFDEIDGASPQLVRFENLLARGRAPLEEAGADPLDTVVDARPDDLATIIYTSGTTGESKGVMLDHAALVAVTADALEVFPITNRDVFLSFLPLSHSFERTAGLYTMFHAGASIAYAESIETVARDAAAVRPTLMVGVPRFFEKFHARVLEAMSSAPAPRRRLFEWALGVGTRALDRGASRASAMDRAKESLARRLVFERLRARIGGRLRFFVSGGAPLRSDVARFFHALGMPIYEGYGLTEFPVISANRPAAFRIGTVGRPFPRVQVRIGEAGEILARGTLASRGYFRKPEATDALVGADGWLRTGDVGEFDAEGFLRITDRIKDLIVTAGGKKIAPQPIENALKSRSLIADAMLLGDERRFVSALLLPDFPALEAFARERGLQFGDRDALCGLPEVVARFESDVAGVNASLAGFETIKRFVILAEELTVADGALTPTMKLKRRVVEERFEKEIAEMYAQEAPA